MNEKKKSLILTIIAVVTLIVFCGVATFAYFVSQGGNDVTKNINVTTNTTDRLTFTIGSEISLTANQEDFGQGMGNKSGSTTASAILVANNSTNTATEHYYLYLNIINNNFEYTTQEETAELILTITDPQGQKLTELNGYKYVTVGDVSGFDITTKNGLITIADNYEITSTNTTIGETQEWEITITFVNLDSDQNANTGKTFNGNLIIQKDELKQSTLAEYIISTYTDGSNGLYYHNGSMSSGVCTYNSNNVLSLNNEGGFEQATNETDCERIFSLTYGDGVTEYFDASIITVGIPIGMVEEVNWNSSSGICESKTSKFPVYSGINGETGVPAFQSECVGYGVIGDGALLLFKEMGSGTFEITNCIDANDNSYRFSGNNYFLTDKALDEGYIELYNLENEANDFSLINFYCNGNLKGFLDLNFCDSFYFTKTYDESIHYNNLKEIEADLENEGYLRYQINNYVCFGSDAATCPSNNLYRIIGVFDDDNDGKYNVKLIKADYISGNVLGFDTDTFVSESYGNNFHVYYKGSLDLDTIPSYNFGNAGLDIDWADNNLNIINLNERFLNSFTKEWQSKVENYIWYLGSIFYGVPKSILENEKNGNYIYKKIGLMYVSDYGFALPSDSWSYDIYNSDGRISVTQITDNWLFEGLCEKTISKLRLEGAGGLSLTNSGAAIRPVFYLNSDVLLVGGNGTESHPYRIS